MKTNMDQPDKLMENDLAFHMSLAQASGNPLATADRMSRHFDESVRLLPAAGMS